MAETRIPEALALLREKGWCKGDYDDAYGRHCIIGALCRASYMMPLEVHTADMGVVSAVIAEQTGWPGIADFNDDPATTFADVEFVMEKAILERGGAL